MFFTNTLFQIMGKTLKNPCRISSLATFKQQNSDWSNNKGRLWKLKLEGRGLATLPYYITVFKNIIMIEIYSLYRRKQPIKKYLSLLWLYVSEKYVVSQTLREFPLNITNNNVFTGDI